MHKPVIVGVIDHEPVLRRAITRHLVEAGFACYELADVNAGLRALGVGFRPDAMVVELTDGVPVERLLGELKKVAERAVVVACGARVAPERVIALKAAGVTAVLERLDLAYDLVAVLEQHLGRVTSRGPDDA
jgi:DNA-binding response OmpR family regulator